MPAALAVAAVLASAALSAAVNVSTGHLPDWGWIDNAGLVWGVTGLLVAACAVLAVLQFRLGDPQTPTLAPTPAPVLETPAPGGSGSNLPPRNPTFTGRADLLDQISDAAGSGPVAIVALAGMGGIGKTQTALEYAHRVRADGSRAITWWVRAESPVTLAEDLAALAPVLDVPVTTEQRETINAVRAALQNRGDWLLVFDNAPDQSSLSGALPSGSGQILITSRHRCWTTMAKHLDVQTFSRAESLAY